MKLDSVYPRRFFSQVLFFVGVAVFFVSLLVGGAFTYDTVARTREQNNNEIIFLAQNIAAMSGVSIVNGDTEFLDDILKMNAQFNVVEAILVVDHENHVLSEVQKRNGRIEKVENTQKITPRQYDRTLEISNQQGVNGLHFIHSFLPADSLMEVWHPIYAGRLLGSIRIHYSQQAFRQQIITQWIKTAAYTVLAVLTILGLLTFFLRLPIRSLRETAQFANSLTSHIGEQMGSYSATEEFAALTYSLNSLSLKLLHQQDELIQSVVHNQAILDNVADGIITLSESGSIQSVNLAASAIFGYIPSEVSGKPITILMHNTGDNPLLNRPFLGEDFLGTQEWVGLRKNQEAFPLELSVTENYGMSDFKYICMARDITERKRLDRLKSEFVSTVSHELRTPLTSISGALKILDSNALGELPEKMKNLVSVAIKNSQRLIVLINDLLDMEKISSGKMVLKIEEVNLIDAIEQSIQGAVSYAAAYGVQYRFEKTQETLLVSADYQRLVQVITNLLSNAAKFSNGSPDVFVRVLVDQKIARVDVEDRGEGIPLDFQGEIFGAFAQANNGNTRRQGGSGLGLKISKALINDMGGDIGYRTQIGEGTVFWFTLHLIENQ